ncbi:MAG: HAD family hydrolase, partial [Flavobacteriales bacterium]
LGFKKPHPECFAKGLALAGSSAERAVMIGDDWECDVDGAIQAGWGAIHFDPHQPAAPSSNPRRISELSALLDLDFNQR